MPRWKSELDVIEQYALEHAFLSALGIWGVHV